MQFSAVAAVDFFGWALLCVVTEQFKYMLVISALSLRLGCWGAICCVGQRTKYTKLLSEVLLGGWVACGCEWVGDESVRYPGGQDVLSCRASDESEGRMIDAVPCLTVLCCTVLCRAVLCADPEAPQGFCPHRC